VHPRVAKRGDPPPHSAFALTGLGSASFSHRAGVLARLNVALQKARSELEVALAAPRRGPRRWLGSLGSAWRALGAAPGWAARGGLLHPGGTCRAVLGSGGGVRAKGAARTAAGGRDPWDLPLSSRKRLATERTSCSRLANAGPHAGGCRKRHPRSASPWLDSSFPSVPPQMSLPLLPKPIPGGSGSTLTALTECPGKQAQREESTRNAARSILVRTKRCSLQNQETSSWRAPREGAGGTQSPLGPGLPGQHPTRRGQPTATSRSGPSAAGMGAGTRSRGHPREPGRGCGEGGT